MGKSGEILTAAAVGLALLGVGIGLWIAFTPEGDQSTDEHAGEIADAIARQRHDSAAGLARAVLATDTGYGTDGVSVLEATDTRYETRTDPMAYLVIRIHHDGFHGYWGWVDPVTACYEMEFDHYGSTEPPDRVRCPDTEPIVPPPVLRLDQPAFADALDEVLTGLPEDPTERDVRDALERRELLASIESLSPPTNPPSFDVLVASADVAVSFRLGADCVLGSRVDGGVETWRPEGACDPAAAMARER